MDNDIGHFDENKIALFDAYLRAEMPPGERLDFEARLAAEPDLRRDFDLHRALLGSIGRNLERAQIREQVRAAQEAILNKPKPKFWRWVLLGIVLLLVMAVGIWYFSPTQSTAPGPTINQDSTMIRSAAGQRAKFKGALQANEFQIINGKRSATPAGLYPFAAFEMSIEHPVSKFENDAIEVFFPKGQLPAQDEFKLFKLTQKQDAGLYLQIENTVYEILPGKHELRAVTDKQVLSWFE